MPKEKEKKQPEISDFVYALPNSYPYNELLLSGKLSAKTRNWKWSHTGLTLLYTSHSVASNIVRAHNLPTKHKVGVIVGYGMLEPVRENTEQELDSLESQFYNFNLDAWDGVWAGQYRYEFSKLTRLPEPIPFKPKPGSVRVLRVPLSVIDGHIPTSLLRARVGS